MVLPAKDVRASLRIRRAHILPRQTGKNHCALVTLVTPASPVARYESTCVLLVFVVLICAYSNSNRGCIFIHINI